MSPYKFVNKRLSLNNRPSSFKHPLKHEIWNKRPGCLFEQIRYILIARFADDGTVLVNCKIVKENQLRRKEL